jgi:predicted GNAT family N-acyltransferase
MDAIVLSEALPSATEYRELRANAGWGIIDEEIDRQTLASACYTVTLRRQGKLIGLARVMGNGALYFFLADLIVDPGVRGEGLGDRLMLTVTEYFDRSAKPGATIALLPLRGAESFYERFGFVRCPDGPFGTGMHYASAPPPAAMPRKE